MDCVVDFSDSSFSSRQLKCYLTVALLP